MPGVVRPTVPADIVAIHALIAGIYADYGYILDVEREDPHLQAPGPHFRATGGEFWVVEEDHQIAAVGAVYLHAEAGELKCLYVDRHHRRAGWGRKLTELAITRARQTDRVQFFLWSDTRFSDAHRLYERIGFHRTDTRHVACTNTYSEFRFELPSDVPLLSLDPLIGCRAAPRP